MKIMAHQERRALTIFKDLSISSLLLMLLFCTPFMSQAQTIVELEEEGAHEIEQSFKQEMNELEIEIGQQPAGVKTDKNQEIIEAYQGISRAFFEGEDLGALFIDFLEGRTFLPADDTLANGPGIDPALESGIQDAVDFVEGWDIRSSDVSDLETLFEKIRTIKNQ